MTAVVLALGVYFSILALLVLIGVHRLYLALVARRGPPRLDPPPPETWPTLVVQVPVYNEAFVAVRAIEAVAALSYPRDRLEIQVLDDSTDDTRLEIARTVAALSARGVPIRVLHRAERTGYKAGALAHGMNETSAERVAIFDADFVPPPDFLLKAMAILESDPGLGLVQGRWAHLNADRSTLTRAQGLFLDAHFSVEHAARSRQGHPFNFNGTAGVWRRAAIEAAGGWSADTLTEDLDLSYRALLAGWRFVYADALEAPAELPETWLGFRAQQARWVRGGVQTARKLLGRVWRAPAWTLGQKLEATMHLTGNIAYLLMALLAILLPVAVYLRHLAAPTGLVGALVDLGSMGIGVGALVYFYATAAALRSRPLPLRDLGLALCVGVGLCLSNAVEVLAALVRPAGEFVRTPKRGEAERGEMVARYRSPSARGRAVLEGGAALLHLVTIGYALVIGSYAVIPFLAIHAIGFGIVSIGTWREETERAEPARNDKMTERRNDDIAKFRL